MSAFNGISDWDTDGSWADMRNKSEPASPAVPPPAVIQAMPTVDPVKLTRLDKAVLEIKEQADAFVCVTALDYEAGGAAIVRLRSVDGMFEEIYKDVKKAHDEAKGKVLAQEKAKRNPLALAKATITTKMLAWKAAEDLRLLEESRVQAAAERARAEAARLATALALEARQKETGNAALADDITALLDQPLDIAPTTIQSTVPKLAGVKIVGRMEVKVTNVEALLVAVGATLIANLPDTPPALKALLQPLTSRALAHILDNPDTVAKIGDVFVPPMRILKQALGDSFNVPGVTAGKKDGLG